MAGDGLRLVPGGVPGVASGGPATDPVTFQDGCLLAFEASQVARGFSRNSMDNGAAVLERFLAACGRPAGRDPRRCGPGGRGAERARAGRLDPAGLRAGVQGLPRVPCRAQASEIEAAFGVRLVNPVDEFNAARHVGADSPSVNPPPDPERMEEFFDFLKERIAGARKYTAAGRDYALFRTLYLAGLRAEESASLDRADVHFGRGPSASCMSGSARVPGHRARGRGGYRCWMAWT